MILTTPIRATQIRTMERIEANLFSYALNQGLPIDPLPVDIQAATSGGWERLHSFARHLAGYFGRVPSSLPAAQLGPIEA
ncbi:MAG TPA: hypothetical protein VME43_02115 [Bryobacteraceae bacterium]|nr:hypothetical protein [Bryobacteraceae bacterium]